MQQKLTVSVTLQYSKGQGVKLWFCFQLQKKYFYKKLTTPVYILVDARSKISCLRKLKTILGNSICNRSTWLIKIQNFEHVWYKMRILSSEC